MIVDCLLLIAVVVVVVVVAVCVFFFVIAGKHVSGDDAKNDNVSGGNLSPFVHIKTCGCCRLLLLLLLLFVSSFSMQENMYPVTMRKTAMFRAVTFRLSFILKRCRCKASGCQRAG